MTEPNETPSGGGPPARRRTGLWRPIALLVVVVALLVAARALGLGERVAELRDWIESLGAWGPLVYVGLYAVAVVVAVPGSPITVLAGALFGSIVGVIVVSAASVLGATLAFLIARYFAREAVSAWLSRSERFTRLDAMTERHGAIMVAITRLVPLFPFNLLNYGFGLTRVRLWTYVFWSWVCMLPGTVLYVVGGDVLVRAVARGGVPWVLIGVLVAVLVLTVLLVRWARRYLREKEAERP